MCSTVYYQFEKKKALSNQINSMDFRLGLDPKVFFDIINSSTGRCWSSEIYNPVPGLSPNAPANNDYKGGFSTALITKVFHRAHFVAIDANRMLYFTD